MNALQLLSVGAFLIAYYYFVLGHYNTLGFRLFSLFFFIAASVGYCWYADYLDLRNVQQNGITTQAVVLKKSGSSLSVRFIDQSGRPVLRTQTGGTSADELSTVREGQSTSILYYPQSDTFYLPGSYKRQLNESQYTPLLPGLLFLIGIICWIFLRKYRIHTHEGTIHEYLTDESGTVVLDDTRINVEKAFRRVGNMGKRV